MHTKLTHVDVNGEIQPGPFIRSPYNYDMNTASATTALDNFEDTLTKQEFKDEVDINTIVRNFGITGELPEQLAVPQSGDFVGVSDYHQAMNIVTESQQAFMQMPADIRDRFNNDPGRFLEFVNDDKNLEQARAWGIAKAAPEAPKEPPPVRVEVVSPSPVTSSGNTGPGLDGLKK